MLMLDASDVQRHIMTADDANDEGRIGWAMRAMGDGEGVIWVTVDGDVG